jgi:hypothetical protein
VFFIPSHTLIIKTKDWNSMTCETLLLLTLKNSNSPLLYESNY